VATSVSPKRFPGESSAYRRSRNKLLDAEVKLRRQVEQVAALRRKLPLGGEIPQDYAFDEEGSRTVRLSQLFQPAKDSLILYSFMYGPSMKHACPMCTSFLDSLDGAAHHVMQRVNLAVVAKSPIERIRKFARSRGWRNLRLLSSFRNTYNRDYHGEAPDGSQMPSLNVFVRRNGKIQHFCNSELLFAKTGKGQDPRHNDMAWPLWNLLDFTPEGRGTDWYPKLDYPG
jgi:predicted dithiol-disulfide oxidoreductase (DUF899 family)